MQTLIDTLAQEFRTITFEQGADFVWSPKTRTIEYNPAAIDKSHGAWSLLHELGHAELNHATYNDDLELLIMEVAAWKQAQAIAVKYSVSIEQTHIDNCLETYRAWLHKRSKCIECGTHSLQRDLTTYQCHNCDTQWKVSASRLCQIRKRRLK